MQTLLKPWLVGQSIVGRIIFGSGFLLTTALGLTCITDQGPENGERVVKVDPHLDLLLSEPGEDVYLPADLSGQVVGTIIDANDDGIGDGIDLDADSQVELIYSGRALDELEKNSTLRQTSLGLAFYFHNDPHWRIYFFWLYNDELTIRPFVNGTGNPIALVMDGGDLIGLDADEDGAPDSLFN